MSQVVPLGDSSSLETGCSRRFTLKTAVVGGRGPETGHWEGHRHFGQITRQAAAGSVRIATLGSWGPGVELPDGRSGAANEDGAERGKPPVSGH